MTDFDFAEHERQLASGEREVLSLEDMPLLKGLSRQPRLSYEAAFGLPGRRVVFGGDEDIFPVDRKEPPNAD